MHISFQELQILSERVLEAKKFPLGLMVDGAEMIVWAEIARLDGLRRLLERMDQLDEIQPDAIQIISESPHMAILDGANQIDLLSARMAADLAYAKAIENGMGIVEVVNCRGNEWVGQNAYQIAQRGLSCMMRWGNMSAIADPDHQQPKILKNRFASDRPDHLLIICSKTTVLEPVEERRLRESQQLQEYWDQAVHEGIEVDPRIWEKLVAISKDVLVESTELSRLKGTGELA